MRPAISSRKEEIETEIRYSHYIPYLISLNWQENQLFCVHSVHQSSRVRWYADASSVVESMGICAILTCVESASARQRMKDIYQVLRNHHGKRPRRRFHHPAQECWYG